MTTQSVTLAVGARTGTVQIHAYGRLLASAVRDGHGWSVLVDGIAHQAPNLDAVLELLRLLPGHHR